MNSGVHKLREVIRSTFVLVLTAVLANVFAAVVPAAEPPANGTKADASDEFFNTPAVRTFDFEIPLQALTQLRRNPRNYVFGNVKEGGQTLTNVGFHLKGMGSFRTVDEKASFVLKFDQAAENQDYFGLTKLMFNNSVQDPTYIVEGL